MISELNKSVSATLYERVASPFYGALTLSWCLWNWEILYVTLFISESTLKLTKIEWITENCANTNNLIFYPVLSTLVILTVIPFVANGAYWLHLKFIKWRRDKKNSIDMKTLLTTEQSIQIREDLINAEEKFEKLLGRKNQEIKELALQLETNKAENLTEKEDAKSENTRVLSTTASKAEDSDAFLGGETVSGIVGKIYSSNELQRALDTIISYIQNGWPGLAENENISPATLAFYEVNHLINNNDGIYSMTDLGKAVVKSVLNDKF